MTKFDGFGFDGGSSMRGICEGLSTKLRRHAPHLLDIHCISHREALAANDASSYFEELQAIDKFANNIYSWLGKSITWRIERANGVISNHKAISVTNSSYYMDF